MEKSELEQVVRNVVQNVLGQKQEERKDVKKACVTLVKGTEVGLKLFEAVPGVDARLADYINSRHGCSMAAGLMELRNCTFDWTLNYEEVDFVVEGTLDIIVGDKTYRGHKGDVVYIPKGTSIKFSTPDRALFFYVTYPADWANQ
ncbi:MAG TPA: DUF861 domain-containing protein [Firmicutes bacterium]|nr:DUF861 domain-containing protein [Bacillota bacterium]